MGHHTAPSPVVRRWEGFFLHGQKDTSALHWLQSRQYCYSQKQCMLISSASWSIQRATMLSKLYLGGCSWFRDWAVQSQRSPRTLSLIHFPSSSRLGAHSHLPKLPSYVIGVVTWGTEDKVMRSHNLFVPSDFPVGTFIPPSLPARSNVHLGHAETINKDKDKEFIAASNPLSWSKQLLWVEYAHNTLPSLATGISPSQFSRWYQPSVFPNQEWEVSILFIQAFIRQCQLTWSQAHSAHFRQDYEGFICHINKHCICCKLPWCRWAVNLLGHWEYNADKLYNKILLYLFYSLFLQLN